MLDEVGDQLCFGSLSKFNDEMVCLLFTEKGT